ncbi:MAG: helix-turn-helix transcriptional regulator [Chlorobi bacterium]|nr:helix-turn-helix transcriptional regulator [Chlorobiota bacterium]
MNTRNLLCSEKAKLSNAESRAFAREKLVYNVTEDLLVFLEDRDISKKELARRLGKSKSYVTQILSGSRNMTLGSFSDICFALDFEAQIKIPLSREVKIQEIELMELKWTSFGSVVKRKSDNMKTYSNIIDINTSRSWAEVA